MGQVINQSINSGPNLQRVDALSWQVPVILLLGFIVLFGPSYYGLLKTVWTDDEQMHGPIVLAVAVWAFYKIRFDLSIPAQFFKSRFGWVVLGIGLSVFLVGKLLGILVFEIGSQVFVAAGCLMLLGGRKALKTAAFPIVFLIFLVPLPGHLIDAVTSSLKNVVSVFAEQILYSLNYPIARSGVMITIGQYQLLVADACSGLRSMFSLSAIGFLYIYLMDHKSFKRNLLLALSLIPIAFLANLIRVMVLILVTYHFGDAAGQGFIHDFAGLGIFVFSVLTLYSLDQGLGRVFSQNPTYPQSVQ
jgi:exosortase B